MRVVPARWAKRLVGLGAEAYIEITDQRLQISCEVVSVRLPWARLRRHREFPGFWILWFDDLGPCPLPKWAFAPEAVAEIRQRLADGFLTVVPSTEPGRPDSVSVEGGR